MTVPSVQRLPGKKPIRNNPPRTARGKRRAQHHAAGEKFHQSKGGWHRG